MGAVQGTPAGRSVRRSMELYEKARQLIPGVSQLISRRPTRAALGISEVSDAICVVVSEETGQISVTNGGRMIRRLDSQRLKTILHAFYGESRRRARPFWRTLPQRLRRFDWPHLSTK